MHTRCRTSRRSLGRRGGRLVVGILPLLGLLAPTAATAQGHAEIRVCSGGGERAVAIPKEQDPTRRPEDWQGGCAHFVCPRERASGDPADDDEE